MNNMKKRRKRLIKERDQLQKKIVKLDRIFCNESFDELEEADQHLLRIQLWSMETYLNVLNARIGE